MFKCFVIISDRCKIRVLATELVRQDRQEPKATHGYDLRTGAITRESPGSCATILRWREKVIRATKSADCAEIGTFRKIGRLAHFGEIGE
jgi:hypothetical protein